ncbi:MAG TPA: amylo-alpha-1,6-glucosidase, partial [Chloroflexota bacterium]
MASRRAFDGRAGHAAVGNARVSLTMSGDESTLEQHTLTIEASRLRERSFLLGNRGGFVLYLPASTNERDATLHSIKWFGASGFGRSFLEAFVIMAEVNGRQVALDRDVQTAFIMRLDEAVRVFVVDGQEIRERYFVPDGAQAVVLTLEGDCTFTVRPELDMRYYQAFNTDFTSYWAEFVDEGVMVGNMVQNVGPSHEAMRFFGLLGTIPGSRCEPIPESDRLIEKTYLKDEHRESLIRSVYTETRDTVPDEAPIWDEYSTKVYSPVCFRAKGPMTLLCAFGDDRQEVESTFGDIRGNLPQMRARKRTVIAAALKEATLETGNKDVDDAYAHVFTRFNDCLVMHDAVLHGVESHREHYYAILAGDKYFLDAWKRDENISLEALLVTNQYETVRHILDNTWQHQDERTGRLPHIIRVGEPLVYYSSDGTLWALHRLYQYTRQSGDGSLLAEKLSMVRHFFQASMHFVQRGLLPSGGIIDKEYLWETWEDTPFTPRDGFPVEIELLWLTVLQEYLPTIGNDRLGRQMAATLAEGKETFSQFRDDGYLVDSIDYTWQQRRLLTPNGYVAFGLDFPLPHDLAHSMVLLARDQLAGRRGVRSLAPRDWPSVLSPAFLADPRSHKGKDMASFGIYNYHRGIEWEWLNPFFVEAELRFGDVQHAYQDYVVGQVDEAVHDAAIGGLSELYDLHGQLGADFQAWSMAAFLESLHLFAGIRVDAV